MFFYSFSKIISILFYSIRSQPFNLAECVAIITRQIESRSTLENVNIIIVILKSSHPVMPVLIRTCNKKKIKLNFKNQKSIAEYISSGLLETDKVVLLVDCLTSFESRHW